MGVYVYHNSSQSLLKVSGRDLPRASGQNKVLISAGDDTAGVYDWYQVDLDSLISQTGIGGGGGSCPIGTILCGVYKTIPVGFLEMKGQELAIEDYLELYNIVGDLTEFQSETEGMFKIPDMTGRVLQGEQENLGGFIEAGLPNITGSVGQGYNTTGINGGWHNSRNTGKADAKSAIYLKGTTNGSSCTWSNYNDSGLITFDASRNNPIYGNSDTVQPPAFASRFLIKAKNVTENLDESIQIDDNAITRENVWSAEQIQTQIDECEENCTGWKGLRTEWDNLTTEEKLKYNGKAVYFTDDEQSGNYLVNPIQMRFTPYTRLLNSVSTSTTKETATVTTTEDCIIVAQVVCANAAGQSQILVNGEAIWSVTGQTKNAMVTGNTVFYATKGVTVEIRGYYGFIKAFSNK